MATRMAIKKKALLKKVERELRELWHLSGKAEEISDLLEIVKGLQTNNQPNAHDKF